jgi:hypothetical protein
MEQYLDGRSGNTGRQAGAGILHPQLLLFRAINFKNNFLISPSNSTGLLKTISAYCAPAQRAGRARAERREQGRGASGGTTVDKRYGA